MFSRQQMGVVDWWLFFILMAIPFVNVVVFVMVLLSSNTNKCLKNYALALILPIVILVLVFIVFGGGIGILNSL